MFKQIDENREEEDLEEGEEDTPAEDEEEEDSDSDADKEEEGEESDEDESEEESDDEEDDEKPEPKKKKGDQDPLAKFKGKTPEELIEMYKNLEGMINTKALEMAQQFLTKKGVKAKKEDSEQEDDFDIGLSDEEIAKMSPKEFARHLNQKITEKATEIAQKAIERSNEVKTNVSREIREATKAHPHLKENKEYREVVLSIIEAANAKNKVITLKEACEKADRALNIKAAEKKEEKVEKKKPRTEVEKQDGGDGGKSKSDEDRVKEGMLNAGNSTFLGGLGV